MTKIFRSAAAGVALFAAVGAGSVAHAQTSASSDARAEILQALTLTNNAALDFGAIVTNAGGAAGSVSVDTNGARTCFGNAICAPGGTEQAAEFTVAGAAGTDVSVSLEDVATNNVVLTHSTDATQEIELTTIFDNTPGVFFGFSGSETFNVGGDIALDGTEIAGTYTGSFEVTVSYQ